MKVTVDVDCTPQELRAFMGLPDVAPIQNAIMDEMQRRMLAEMDHFSPTTIMKDWFAPAAGMQQAMLRLFTPSGKAGTSSASAADEEQSEDAS